MHEDHYRWNKVTTCVHNLFGGQRWVDQYGDLIITNNKGIRCKLNFAKASYWSSNRYEVVGSVTDPNGKLVHHLFGNFVFFFLGTALIMSRREKSYGITWSSSSNNRKMERRFILRSGAFGSMRLETRCPSRGSRTLLRLFPICDWTERPWTLPGWRPTANRQPIPTGSASAGRGQRSRSRSFQVATGAGAAWAAHRQRATRYQARAQMVQMHHVWHRRGRGREMGIRSQLLGC